MLEPFLLFLHLTSLHLLCSSWEIGAIQCLLGRKIGFSQKFEKGSEHFESKIWAKPIFKMFQFPEIRNVSHWNCVIFFRSRTDFRLNSYRKRLSNDYYFPNFTRWKFPFYLAFGSAFIFIFRNFSFLSPYFSCLCSFYHNNLNTPSSTLSLLLNHLACMNRIHVMLTTVATTSISYTHVVHVCVCGLCCAVPLNI